MRSLERLRRRRRLTVGTAVLTVVATAAALVVSFGGVASALPPPGAGAGAGTFPVSATTFFNDSPRTRLNSGAANQAIPDWHVVLNDNVASATQDAWTVGDHLSFLIGPNGTNGNADPFQAGGPNSVEASNFVSFSGVPTVFVSGGPAGIVLDSPTLSCVVKPFVGNSIATQNAVNDLLECTFTNSGNGLSLSPYVLTFNGIKVTTGSKTANGDIQVYELYGSGALTAAGGDVYPCTSAFAGSACGVGPAGFGLHVGNQLGRNGGSPDVEVIDAFATANNPAVSILPNAVAAAISPIVIHENRSGVIPGGNPGTNHYICYQAHRFTWDSASTPFISSVSNPLGGATAMSPVVNILGPANIYVVALVLTTGTFPSTITLSGMKVDVGNDVGPYSVSIWYGDSPTCTRHATDVEIPGDQNFEDTVVFTVGNATVNTRIAGSNLDQTAVASLYAAFPAVWGDGCLPHNSPPDPNHDDIGSSIVIATDATWQDALTASYLAAFLHTGVLLTPTNSLSAYTETAVRNEGVSSVYLVGGILAISQKVEDQLKGTPQYQCTGATLRKGDLGGNLNVTRIAGATDLDTAMRVATWVDSGFVNFHAGLDLSGAAGLYNHSGGGTDTGGTLATIPVRTAILATNNTFQDATAAGSLSYFERMPVFLTAPGGLSPQAATGLLDLGINQTVLLGGNIAISDQVVTDLTGIGIKSLRIGGTDFSDTSVQLAEFELNANHGLNGHNAGLDWEVFGPSSKTECETRHANQDGDNIDDCFTAAIARGDFYADALTSSVVTGGNGVHDNEVGGEGPMPILLTINPSTVGGPLTGFFNSAGSPYGAANLGYPFTVSSPGDVGGKAVSSIVPFGGYLALSDATLQAILNAISAGANHA